ncbi:anaerobic sulfite reductase subunit AsrB [Candidatus Woesearchaeota archaeon]|nr:anaerobic sulfite reductase subunit AsrB [Candidatus Woesearchaeota archaeon]
MTEENPYLPELVKVDKVMKETDDTSIIRLKSEKEYEPGQFFEVSLLGIGECPISVCSCSRDYLDLCVRGVGNVTRALLELKPGDKVGIRGPYGKGYPMDDFFGKNILIIGGGTGAAPLRGVLEYVTENRDSFNDVSIFLGFREPDDILFSREIESWKKQYDLKLTVDKADNKWKGNVGVVTDLLEKAKLNKDNTAVIICGPPVMIRFVVQLLEELGFDDRQIWVSLERHMKCGVGKCGRCMVNGKRICEDGPVFSYIDAKSLID